MKNYQELLKQILKHGEHRGDRTGTGTQALFGTTLRFNLEESFPLITSKKVWIHGVLQELLWFLSGETNIKRLTEANVHIWDDWATKDGEVGPMYGTQWRAWQGYDATYDQIAKLIDDLKNNPNSRRHILSTWNVHLLPDEHVAPDENAAQGKMALAPCHILAQFFVSKSGKLSSLVFQRSADMFLGVPFDLASYGFLTHMIAHVCGYEVGEMVYHLGDSHIYSNHRDQVNELLSRPPRPGPTLEITRKVESIDDFKESDFLVQGYMPYPAIKAPISV